MDDSCLIVNIAMVNKYKGYMERVTHCHSAFPAINGGSHASLHNNHFHIARG